MRILLLFLFAAISVVAQPRSSIVYVTTSPSGACGSTDPLQYNTTNGALSGCNAGTWATISGGGSPGGTNNQIQYRIDATTFGGFTMSGDCTLVVATGVITCTSGGSVTGSGAAARGAFWASSSALTSSGNWTYAATSGHTLIQGANNVDAFGISRFTDTSPTGNFLRFQNAALNTDLFKVGVAGDTTTSSVTINDTTHSATIVLNGVTSGAKAIVVNDVAGTAVAYILPAGVPVANQIMYVVGTATCPTLPVGAPATCYQLALETPASANTASALVIRDGSGNFSAGTITANLVGNVTGSAVAITGTIIEANTPLTTKGDLLVDDGTLLGRIAVGIDGQVLAADSTQTYGVKWAAGATVPGSDTQCVFNDAGSLGADAGCTYDKTNNIQSLNGGYLKINSGATASEQFSLAGRVGVGIIVPFLAPVTNNAVAAFDISVKGVPSADFSANTGVVWIDGCSIDCYTSNNYESFRIGKMLSGDVHFGAAAGGTGTVRNLQLQVNGGKVGIGYSPNDALGSLFNINATANPAFQLDTSKTARGYFFAATSGNAFVTNTAANDIGIRGTGGKIFFASNSSTPAAALIIDNTTNGNRITLGGHVIGQNFSGTTSVSACGTSPSIVGTDLSGRAVQGSVSTGCTINFGLTYSTTPNCTVTDEAGLAFSYTVSTTQIIVTNIGALSSTAMQYTCTQ